MRTVRLRARMVREVMRAGVAAMACWAISMRRRNWARDSLKALRPSGSVVEGRRRMRSASEA